MFNNITANIVAEMDVSSTKDNLEKLANDSAESINPKTWTNISDAMWTTKTPSSSPFSTLWSSSSPSSSSSSSSHVLGNRWRRHLLIVSHLLLFSCAECFISEYNTSTSNRKRALCYHHRHRAYEIFKRQRLKEKKRKNRKRFKEKEKKKVGLGLHVRPVNPVNFQRVNRQFFGYFVSMSHM